MSGWDQLSFGNALKSNDVTHSDWILFSETDVSNLIQAHFTISIKHDEPRLHENPR